MELPVIPQHPSLPEWLLKAADAANDNMELTAREMAQLRWAGPAAEKVVDGVAETTGGALETCAAIATPVAFLGVMGLAAYAYLSDRAYYQNKLFIPCGAEPKRRNLLPSGSPAQHPVEWMPQRTILLPHPLSPRERALVRAYVARPEFSESAALGIDTKGKTVKVVLQEMQKMLELAAQIASKKIEIHQHQQNGQAHLVRRAQQELNQLMAHAQTIEQQDVPAVSMGLQIKASAASVSPQPSADKTWWSEKDKDQKPERGNRRWYIEKTRDGFRVTQLQEWNGSDWRPLRLKGEAIPTALQIQLEEWNSPSKPQPKQQVAAAQPPPRTNSAPLPAGSNLQAIDENMRTLKRLDDGSHVIYADASGRLQDSGFPLSVSVTTDPETDLRRWKVTPQGSALVHVNLQRAIERLDADGYQHDQLVGMLGVIHQRYSRIQVAPVSRTGWWHRVTTDFSPDYNHGQAGYRLQFIPQRGGNPPRWQFADHITYSRQSGWQNALKGHFPHTVISRAVEATNQKFAAEFEATQQGQQAARALFVTDVMQVPSSPIRRLSDGEIQANARGVRSQIEYMKRDGRVLFSIYFGREGFVENAANYGRDSFDVVLGYDPDRGEYGVVHVTASVMSSDSSVSHEHRWKAVRVDGQGAWAVYDNCHPDQGVISETLPPSVPIDAIERTLAEINRRAVPLTETEVAAGASAIAQRFDGKSSVFELVYVDSDGRVLAGQPLSGTSFELRVSRKAPSSPDVKLNSVWALSGDHWLWEADASVASRADGSGKTMWGVHTPLGGVLPQIEIPSEFPLEAVEKVLETVRHKLTTSHDTARIAKALSADPVQTFKIDSTGRVDGKDGMRFEVTLRWDEGQKWAETTHVTAFDKNGNEVLWTATLENGAYMYRRGDIESCRVELPSEFPTKAFVEVLGAIRVKMPSTGGVKP